MKKRLMTLALLCCAMTTTVVNAQTTENESTSDKYFRLSKIADENPSDWKAQLEVGHILLDKESGFYNQTRAARYYERIYHTATDFNKEIPDSVLRETLLMLVTQATDKKAVNKALFFIEEAKHAEKVGVDLGDASLQFDAYGYFYSLITGNGAESLIYIMDLRKKLADKQLSGIEYTDFSAAMAFERMVDTYKKMFGDKVIEITFDGKKYIILAVNDWNIENPLMGWMESMDDEPDKAEAKKPKLLYGEDGKIYDDLHGQLIFSFKCDKEGVKPQEGANVRFISVTPEQRQKMIEAYREYMKKK